jgi:type III secretion protein J
MGSRSPAQSAVALAILLLLSGCKIELYSQLTEGQGNEILALLLSHQIPATKVQVKNNLVSIQVDESDVVSAVEILNRSGLPREEFDTLGDVFQQKGLISSPLDERVRYSYGLSQSISDTLSQIDGVLTSRVHVVLPVKGSSDERQEPASASVLIRYRAGSSLEDDVPKIKDIVQNSVPGLAYERVSVALFESDTGPLTKAEGPAIAQFLGIRVVEDSMAELIVTLALLAFVALGGIGATMFLLLRGGKKASDQAGAADA